MLNAGSAKMICWASDELKEYARQMSDNWDQTNARIEKQLTSALIKNNGGVKPDIE